MPDAFDMAEDAKRREFQRALERSLLDKATTDPYGAVTSADFLSKNPLLKSMIGGPGLDAGRAGAMRELAARSLDPFTIALREASMAVIRNKGTSRKNTFVVGPRGLEGPLGNTILGGGTSLLGS